MAANPIPLQNEALGEALAHMASALALLDAAAAPAQIGAHLDLAICELREVIRGGNSPNSSLSRNR
jgi:hypothetical protein